VEKKYIETFGSFTEYFKSMPPYNNVTVTLTLILDLLNPNQ